MTARFGLIFVCMTLSGCLATSKAIIGPDGKQNELISCSSIKYCYEKASEVCRGSYKIVDKSSEVSSHVDDTVHTETTLLVKCER